MNSSLKEGKSPLKKQKKNTFLYQPALIFLPQAQIAELSFDISNR